jgi:hypothetical protein
MSFKIVFLALFLLLIFSCSTETPTNSNPNNNLMKPLDIYSYENTNTTSHPSWNYFVDRVWDKIPEKKKNWVYNWCSFDLFDLFSWGPSLHSYSNANKYDFRDNYLSKSDKGNEYIVAYYFLSRYSIENNLINKYPSLHRDIFRNGLKIAFDLQYGKNANKILFDDRTIDLINEVVDLYKESENYPEIEIIVDYLESDLNEFINMPLNEIQLKFNQ